MRPKEYDSIHRRYYHDHPTSLNHNEPYMVPLENQYSVLNQARNPYHVLDNLNLQISKKYPIAQSRVNPIAFPQEESLDNEMRSWNTKQTSKDKDYQNMKYELEDLSNLLKRKEDQY